MHTLHPTRGLAFVPPLLLAAVACGGQDGALREARDLMTPLALESTLVLVDKRAPNAYLFDAAADPLPATATEVDLPHDPSLLVRRNGADEALVLCQGRRAEGDHDEEPAALVALPGNGKARVYELGNPFSTLVQSADGRYAFLLKGQQSDRLLDNPNEVAIVDLTGNPKDESSVTLRTLTSFGDSPSSIVFSPEMQIVDEARRLAVVLSPTNVTLIDLGHLERRETTVQLSGQGESDVTPAQIVFSPDAPEIYVRATGSSDVYVFHLSPRAAGDVRDDDTPRNDFRPFIDQLGVGGAPTDMTLYPTDTGSKLLVLSGGGTSLPGGGTHRASVVDAATSAVTTVGLPNVATKALLFTATSPRDQVSRPRALLYQPGSNQVLFLDLEDLEERGSRNLEALALQSNITQVVPMLEEGLVLALHDGHSVSLIDLAGRTVSPITTQQSLEGALFDPERRRLWVAPRNQSYIGWLELDTGEPRETLLDADIQTVVPMFESGHLVVMHASDVGYLTVLDADKPTAEAARSARGFLAAGLLDRGE